jgi:hypothetical protein
VGEGVDATRVGQRVWVWEAAYQRPEGTAQEYALVPARRVIPLPDDAAFDVGASLGVPFLTAHRCLTVTEGGPHRLGPGSLDGRTVFDHKLFPTFYVNGRRRRIGGDAEWRNGPFQLRGEVIDVRDDRRGEGTDDDDLPRLRSGGGYVSGTWIVTGEKKTDAVKPKHPLPRQGFGAVEIAGRVEWIGIGSSMGRELSAGPRAAVPADQRAHVVTLGVNWYLNRFVRLAANVIHETRYDGDVVVKTEQLPWAPVIRFQFGL